jgi:hypothetical protein
VKALFASFLEIFGYDRFDLARLKGMKVDGVGDLDIDGFAERSFGLDHLPLVWN